MRRWVILGVLLALVLAVVWWFFFIQPRRGNIDQAHKDYQVTLDEAARLQGQVDALIDIRNAEVEYLAGIGQLETLIPLEPLLDQFIEDIYSLCGTTGVELLNLAPAMPVPMTDSALRQITVAVTIDGQFHEVLGFLYGVQQLERLVRVDAVAISSGQDETGATSLSVSLSMRLFTLADLLPVAGAPEDGGTTPGDGSTDSGETPEAQTTIVPSTISSTTVPSGEG